MEGGGSEVVVPPNKRTVALFAVLPAADKNNVSAGRLWKTARARSGLDPDLQRQVGATRYYGLYQFQATQWRETMLALGKPLAEAFAADIMDVDAQAGAAAYLQANGRPIRGEGING